ncbi:hypothetical protein [Luteibacter sp. 9133]|uniref:hypothetical protein n=1 Tax=Luteibacter sp. 9133 TaxID=1500891 RepID=UPI0018CE7637|nr:hypothetical protein [Luteibacter sp. 9133]
MRQISQGRHDLPYGRWLSQIRSRAELGRHLMGIAGGDEKEWHADPSQRLCDREGRAIQQIDVEHGSSRWAHGNFLQRTGSGRARPGYIYPGFRQDVRPESPQDRVIFDDQESNALDLHRSPASGHHGGQRDPKNGMPG